MKNYSTNNYEHVALDAMKNEDYTAAQIVATLAVAKELHAANVIAASVALDNPEVGGDSALTIELEMGWKKS